MPTGHTTRQEDMIGRVFARLTVVAGPFKQRKNYWLCRCACKKEKLIRQDHLKIGATISCGCAYIKHGHAKAEGSSPEYTAWVNMKARCFRVDHPKYKDYGARGITVCNRWMKFENFFADMGSKPKGFSIDRKNNNGNYEPRNCKWATRKEQQNNRRANVLLTARGRTLNLTEWSEVPGAAKAIAIRSRLARGWNHEESIFTISDQRYKGKYNGKTRLTARGETLSVAKWSKISGIKLSTIYVRIDRGWPVEKAIFTPIWGWRNG